MMKFQILRVCRSYDMCNVSIMASSLNALISLCFFCKTMVFFFAESFTSPSPSPKFWFVESEASPRFSTMVFTIS